MVKKDVANVNELSKEGNMNAKYLVVPFPA
jgi:hypothetical protein